MTTTTTTMAKILPAVVVAEPAVVLEGSPRRRKGKNFCPEEECSLCRSFLAVSQGPVVENGQKMASMWERVAASFNEKNQALGLAPRSARSLESKWGTIKHDVSIFVGCHASVENSKQFGTSEDVIEKALELYRSKHPKGGAFIHLHCWRILHEVPQWCDHGDDGVKVAPAKAALGQIAPPVSVPPIVAEKEEQAAQEGDGVARVETAACGPAQVREDVPDASGDEEEPTPRSQGDNRGEPGSEQRHPKRLRRVKVDKEAKARECALRAQARAMADMAAASRMKAEILADQSALQLFTLPLSSVTEADAREYLMLRRQEEIIKMRKRLLAQTAAPAPTLPLDPTAPTPPSPALPSQSPKQPTTGNSALSVRSRCERQYQTS